MTGLVVVAPVAGTVVGLAGVPDPVFAQELVGSGTAVEPADGAGVVTVVAPVAGNLMKVHSHAFVVLTADGVGVLVHLGIDTVHLGGEGFTLHRAEGDDVTQGAPVVSFDVALVRGKDLSAVCPVVSLLDDRRKSKGGLNPSDGGCADRPTSGPDPR